jgi:hypothetical protein
MAERLLIVGLDEPEAQTVRERVALPVVWYELLSRIRVRAGVLGVESPRADGRFLAVSRAVYHGIFEDDLPLLSALALWGGPCFPRARGMMDCRLRLPCLVRALGVTRFGGLGRGYADRGLEGRAPVDSVAKWGEWHCGENKARFRGEWVAEVPTLFEEFVAGEAVRVQLVGDQAWQFRLGGDDWKKSIHGPGAALMEQDAELVEDARRLQAHFGLEVLGVDYMVAGDGGKHLLEVNHIPSVTAFEEVRQAYLGEVVRWAGRPAGGEGSGGLG